MICAEVVPRTIGHPPAARFCRGTRDRSCSLLRRIDFALVLPRHDEGAADAAVLMKPSRYHAQRCATAGAGAFVSDGNDDVDVGWGAAL
jgi:hypothetical protein